MILSIENSLKFSKVESQPSNMREKWELNYNEKWLLYFNGGD